MISWYHIHSTASQSYIGLQLYIYVGQWTYVTQHNILQLYDKYIHVYVHSYACIVCVVIVCNHALNKKVCKWYVLQLDHVNYIPLINIITFPDHDYCWRCSIKLWWCVILEYFKDYVYYRTYTHTYVYQYEVTMYINSSNSRNIHPKFKLTLYIYIYIYIYIMAIFTMYGIKCSQSWTASVWYRAWIRLWF